MIFAGGLVGKHLMVGWDEGESELTPTFHAKMAPVEFLYLDSTRILNYLAQLEGGRAGAVHRITKQIREVNGEASAGSVKIGASAQREDAVESTLAPAETSAMAILLKDLREDTLPGVEIHQVDLTKRSELMQLKEGWLVRFPTRYLLSPGYIRPYLVIRKSATLAALFPKTIGDQSSEKRAEEQRAEAKGFVNKIGLNPRITFAIDPSQPVPGQGRPVKVLLPMQYADLSEERSLLERGRGRYSGGNLVVVGKVIRVFRKRSKGPGSRQRPDYTDFATRQTWTNPLKQTNNGLVDWVGNGCKVRWPVHGQHHHKKKWIEGRRCFLIKLRRQTRLTAPGAVVLPLAVYK